MQTLIFKKAVVAILISEKDFRRKQIIEDRQALHNNKRINPLVRHFDLKCVCTRQQSQNAWTKNWESHRQIHTIDADFNTPFSAIATSTSKKQENEELSNT